MAQFLRFHNTGKRPIIINVDLVTSYGARFLPPQFEDEDGTWIAFDNGNEIHVIEKFDEVDSAIAEFKHFNDRTMAEALTDIAAKLEWIVPNRGDERERLNDARELLARHIKELKGDTDAAQRLR